jgi:tetratricopeptide (TPR) repeat protein
LFPNGRRFALSDQPGYGVSCGATGVFVGAVPLSQPCRNCGNFQKWRARPLDELNRDLSMCYGVPVDFGAKVERLAAIARALDRGDLLHAHIATLHLQISRSARTRERAAVRFWTRGDVYRCVGEYEKALEDLDRAEAINPAQWAEAAFGLVSQADCHARLGNEVAALACCERLPDDFWTGSMEGAPRGSKAEIAQELRQIAADARRRRV